MDEIIFTDGLFFNEPNEKAPDFVKGSLSIEPKQFTEWLRKHYDKNEKYIRIDLKVSKQGKAYASLSTFRPNQTQGGSPQQSGSNSADGFEDDIPF